MGYSVILKSLGGVRVRSFVGFLYSRFFWVFIRGDKFLVNFIYLFRIREDFWKFEASWVWFVGWDRLSGSGLEGRMGRYYIFFI